MFRSGVPRGKSESGNGVEGGFLFVDVVELVQLLVCAVAAIPRWMSWLCPGTLDRRARVMPVLSGAIGKEMVLAREEIEARKGYLSE